MGKKLVITGADFSANSIGQSYYPLYKSSFRGQADAHVNNRPCYPPVSVQLQIRGRVLYMVKFYPYTSGLVSIVKSSGSSPSISPTTLEQFTITENQVGTEVELVLTNPYTIGSTDWIGIGNPNNGDDVHISYLNTNSQSRGAGMWYAASNSMKESTSGDLLFSFYSYG